MLWFLAEPISSEYLKAEALQVYDRGMKTLLCILLFSAAAFGQIADAERQDRREKPGCERIQPFPGVLLAPSDDQTITGAHSLIFQTGVESLRLFPGFQENHSAFAQGAGFLHPCRCGISSPLH